MITFSFPKFFTYFCRVKIERLLIVRQEGTEGLSTYFLVTIAENQPDKMNNSMKKFSSSPNCPIRNVLDRFGDKWSILIILILGEHEKLRFNELNKIIGDVSQKMLTVTLRTLEADGLVKRTIYPEVPPRVEYEITELGKSLLPHIEALSAWAVDHLPEIAASRKKFVA